MGILIIIGIMVLIVIASSKGAGTTSSNHGFSAPSNFEIRVREETASFGDIQAKVLTVAMRGPITAPHDGYNATTKLSVVDITGGEKYPIISAIDVLQSGDSVALGFKTSQKIPYRMSVIKDWMTLVKIPLDTLTFPRAGTRRLELFVHVEGALAIAKTTVSYTCTEPGYLDTIDNRRRFEEKTVELAFAVSASDGDVDRNEASVIKTWIQKRIALAPESQTETVKSTLNNVIKTAYEAFNNGNRHDVLRICSDLKKVATTAERYEALELCLQVAKADGVAEQDELEILEDLAEHLGLDKEKFRAMKDKHLTVSMMNNSDVMDVDRLLGLCSDMSPAEKKKHLREEFKKWNQLAEHSDPGKRDQAKQMLALIGQKRAELKNE